jgi:molybdenum cofactor cytidylyltransferase
MKTGIILLAAGSSSRLGRAKQLIEFQGKTLIQKAIDEANKSQANCLVVVLGANAELIQTGFDSSSTPFIVNPDWQQGMSTSMQAGLRFLMEKEVIDQVLLMLCDQPFVDASLLDELITAKETSGKGIVAAAYSNTLGVPALFDRRYFEELVQLTGSEGAKKVIFNHQAEVHALDFPLGAVDLDTEEDVSQFLIRYPQKNLPNPS